MIIEEKVCCPLEETSHQVLYYKQAKTWVAAIIGVNEVAALRAQVGTHQQVKSECEEGKFEEEYYGEQVWQLVVRAEWEAVVNLVEAYKDQIGEVALEQWLIKNCCEKIETPQKPTNSKIA